MGLTEEKYILVTTFRRDSTPVSTPVWSVALEDGKLGFWTSSQSGKAKRLAHTDRVTVQPCDARGRVKKGTQPLDAAGRVVTGAEYATIQAKVKAKYGFMTNITKLLGTLGGLVKMERIPYGDCGVVLTPT